uniref:tRNA(Ile2) 2-agmatinylcytidine synthetase TiaS n=1 Tax=Ignisphaera aggregans TaxID=334771 RepID=A0A7C2ZCR7_9CREN
MIGQNNSRCIIHVGLDDFDLYFYGCTTHAATFIIHKLVELLPIQFIDYPNLVRLNPSIPWKTRGNGAVALRFAIPCSHVEKTLTVIEKAALEYYEKLSKATGIELDETGKEPGILVALDPLPQIFAKLYTSALTDVVPYAVALEKIRSLRNSIYLIEKFGGRGIVGAAAAIGWITQNSDYTYELIAYRSKYRYTVPRCIDHESVKHFAELTSRTTFNNIDFETGRILITSHSFDPVLYGVRGDSVDDLARALEIIRTCEPVVAWTLFRTNQGTDAHIVDRRVENMRTYRTGRLKLKIISNPETIPGGHVIVRGSDGTGSITLALFKPSGLTTIAKKLTIGDEIIVQGHAKPWRDSTCFHVEKIAVLKLTKLYSCKAPRCPICGKRMTKSGFGKGYKCRYCGYRSLSLYPECRELLREIQPKLFLPPPSEQKHLIKPLTRYGRERASHPLLAPVEVSKFTRIIEPPGFL